MFAQANITSQLLKISELNVMHLKGKKVLKESFRNNFLQSLFQIYSHILYVKEANNM